MATNASLDEAIVSDTCVNLGVLENAIDIISVRAAFEHFSDNASFLKNCALALREDGIVILTFPGRYAPFAIINRVLPGGFSSWLLRNLIPDGKEELGFQAYYTLCYDSATRRAAGDAELTVETAFYDFYSRDYFAFFTPLYVLSLLYDHLRHLLGIRDSASYYTFVLRKGAPLGRAGSPALEAVPVNTTLEST
jgi:SAM-dependent methyltransferase